MIKLPRSQSSQIKNVIYPQSKKIDKAVHQKNIQAIKSKQITNRQKKEDIENAVPVEPYKLKQFKQVESKLAKTLLNNQTCENTNYQSENQNPSYKNDPPSRGNISKNDYNVSKTTKSSLNKVGNLVSTGLNRNKSHNEIIKVNKEKSGEYVIFQNPNHDILPEYEVLKKNSNSLKNQLKAPKPQEEEESIFNLGKPKNNLPIRNVVDNYHSDEDVNGSIRNEYEDEENNHLENLQNNRGNVNANLSGNHISKKNYISENRNKVILQEIPQKSKVKEESKQQNNPIHKSFGKIPNYLQKYKQDAEDKKDLEKKLAEEAKYPKGTRLLCEEERLETLNNLINTRKELINLLEKMPISMRTMALQTKKMDMEKKLNEIEEGIKTFSRKQVFVKIEG